MTTKKDFERPVAQHETPPPADDRGRLRYAVPKKSSPLPLVGGGSLDDSGVCRPLTFQYIEEMLDLGTPGECADSVGLNLCDMLALPAESRNAVIREKPIEVLTRIAQMTL